MFSSLLQDSTFINFSLQNESSANWLSHIIFKLFMLESTISSKLGNVTCSDYAIE